MSGATSVPSVSFTDNGFVVPQESAIITGLDADYTAAFGGTLNTDPATPAGQLIVSTGAILGDSNNQQVGLFNGVDPAYASGRMQDAIARIYFLERNPAQSTVLQIQCIGLVGVLIPIGALIEDDNGNLYLCTGAGTFKISGTMTLSFAAQVPGPLAVPASVSIYQAIPGWNTVSVVSGVVGNNVETRQAFEARRQATVAANAVGTLAAIAGQVAKVPGVIDYYVTENYTSSPVTVGGVTLNANSVYVCVAGGAANDVAMAIWRKKPPGCNYTGNTTVVVTDTNDGYQIPYPSYNVTFELPTAEPICMIVSINNNPGVPSNAAQLIQAAIVYAFLGEDNGTRARIGSEIFASRYYAAVASQGSWAIVISILMGTNASPAASFTGSITATTLTVSGVTGTIAIGQFVYGAGVASGTIITAGSGTSWTVSVNQSVTSEAMTSVTANQNALTMNINQLPTLASADISVVLV
ncbi:MAG: baseplate J/gp47 family protein [Rhodopila sp.]|nr:baseplate J/gp47 family protein [Rhodopila sp.]